MRWRQFLQRCSFERPYPQGLKPPNWWRLSARLKPCPDVTLDPPEMRVPRSRKEEHGAWFGVAVAVESYHDAIADAWFFAEFCFEIFGVNVQARRGDDYVFLAAFEIEVAVGVALAQIAGVKPAVRVEDGGDA